jgi:hypothetical protein
MSGISMLDGNEGSRRRAQCHGLPASLLAHIERKTEGATGSNGKKGMGYGQMFRELSHRGRIAALDDYYHCLCLRPG